ncbi:MAG: flagellar filament capping protein FliD [Phycisphaerales bacterium]|nr:flagellar filament capping protein FliD [Phycisphaerales bacterium]
MGTLSAGTGLISGMNISGIVTQLMQIESRPLNLLQNQITKITAEKTAFTTISAMLLAAKTSINRLAQPSAFTVRSAVSSNENVLTATAASNAPISSYTFRVQSLVSTHQLMSNGFASRNSTPVGTGSLTFKAAEGFVNPSTSLSQLNGTEGIRRGVIRITDRSGAFADIDLRTATQVTDVLQAINDNIAINVRASVSGDRLVIEDQTGLGTGNLIIADLNQGNAAADLGIRGTSATGRIEGADLIRLTGNTLLSQLNDGIGLRYNTNAHDLKFTMSDGSEFNVNLTASLRFRTEAKDDPPTPAIRSTNLGELNDGRGLRTGTNGELQIRVTNRAGQSGIIDLSSARTIDDVKEAFANAVADDGVTPLNVKISALTSAALVITDSSGGTTSNLKIENVDGAGFAATDLGIAIDTAQTGFTGTNVYRMNSLGAVMRAIQYAEDSGGNTNDGRLQVAISADGNGLVLTDTTGGGGTASVEALNGSMALRDLGLQSGFVGDTLQSSHLIAGLNTVLLSSLNGGNGIATEVLRFQLRDQSTLEVDFAGANTLQEVLDRMNATGRLSARVDAGGLGIQIDDLTTGTGTFGILDDPGTGQPPQMAVDLGLARNSAGQLVSGDLHRQYVAENTLLSELNFGKGIPYGKFTIQDGSGGIATVNLTAGLHKTVGDVLREINALSDVQVTARINATGDGIELVDTSGGGSLIVNDLSGGSMAASLGIAGTSTDGTITGSFTKVIEVDGDDTLDDLVEKINKTGVGVTASVISDGSGFSPYRLMLNSRNTGTAGRLAFDIQGTGLSLNTLSEGRDAVVVIGDPDSPAAIVVSSSSNTITDVLPGVTLNLHGTSANPVELNVNRDVGQVVTDVQTFISTFNEAIDKINELTKYDSSTQTRGILLGDGTATQIRDRLYRILLSGIDDESMVYRRLGAVGISIESGSKLALDETKFRAAFDENPEVVKDLFAKTRIEKQSDGKDKLINIGFAARLNEALNSFTTTADGLITRKNNALQNKIDMMNDRATYMQKMLDRKEARLYTQFQTMESALANLQSQQSSLNNLASLVSSMYSN